MSDVKMYMTCPRQLFLYKEYGSRPSEAMSEGIETHSLIKKMILGSLSATIGDNRSAKMARVFQSDVLHLLNLNADEIMVERPFEINYAGIDIASGGIDYYDETTNTVWDWKTTGDAKKKQFVNRPPQSDLLVQAAFYGAYIIQSSMDDISSVSFRFVFMDELQSCIVKFDLSEEQIGDMFYHIFTPIDHIVSDFGPLKYDIPAMGKLVRFGKLTACDYCNYREECE
jgi:hypothetical protein